MKDLKEKEGSGAGQKPTVYRPRHEIMEDVGRGKMGLPACNTNWPPLVCLFLLHSGEDITSHVIFNYILLDSTV